MKLLPSSSILEMATLGGAKSINKLDSLGSTPNNIETSIIDGKVIMENNQIITVDEEKILHKTQQILNKLIANVGLGNVQWGKIILFLHVKNFIMILKIK
ncbi:hypothetical protein IR152_10215 [Clostridioides sp. ES-S-0108-01]|uniref:hypothetical protein n=1 Tax=Clostridioides sp. ES-S-0108-01 TaxID=2770773 RepID=UPI001D0C3CF0|nr:hypothetical protein [Clostridioides sp. ES-S-0108-01]UDN50512.1 hypothetical protein JJC16_14275 [Clostridioides sp. ES-S-0107-01]